MRQRAEARRAECDELEAELEAVRSDVIVAAEERHAQALAEAEDAEHAFTEGSASMLAEYAEVHARICGLEAELAEAKEIRAEVEARNLEVVRGNLRLDREAHHVQREIEEAQELLRRHAASQGSLDAELREGLRRCEAAKDAAREQGERLADEVRRFAAMQSRLAELLSAAAVEFAAAPGGGAGFVPGGVSVTPRTPGRAKAGAILAADADVTRVLADAAAAEAVLRGALAECEKVVSEGIVPEDEPGVGSGTADADREAENSVGGVGDGDGPCVAAFDGNSSAALASRVGRDEEWAASAATLSGPLCPVAGAVATDSADAEATSRAIESRLATFESRLEALARSVASSSAAAPVARSSPAASGAPADCDAAPLSAPADDSSPAAGTDADADAPQEADEESSAVLTPESREPTPMAGDGEGEAPSAARDEGEQRRLAQQRLDEVSRRAQQLDRLWSILAEAPDKFDSLPKEKRDAFLMQAEGLASASAAIGTETPATPPHDALAALLSS